MALSEEDRRKLAKEIVVEFFRHIDMSLGGSIRRKLFYIALAVLLASAVFLGVIKIPGG